MVVRCQTCGVVYDDAAHWTICPHAWLDMPPDTAYCRAHDLFDCGICKGEKVELNVTIKP